MADSNRKELLKAYEDLRVADVRDGMDTMLQHHCGSMSPAIRPLFRTRTFGIARTCRYVPYSGTIPEVSPEEYWGWSSRYYEKTCPYPWIEDIEEGDFIVIDQSGVDAGLMGSENTLTCVRKGARGFVTSGGVRDTDEIIRQKVPFWSAMISQSMVQGRLQFDRKDIPVAVGGVLVCPGDIVVADGDGVIVVPRQLALAVAEHAHAEHQRDKKRRADHYKSLGWEPDSTVT